MSYGAFGDADVVARKPHSCCYCDATIQAGTKYRRWACADEGRVWTAKAHTFCADAAPEVLDWEDELWDSADFRERVEATWVPGVILPWAKEAA